MLEVYVQLMHRERPQVKVWQQRGSGRGRAGLLFTQSTQMLAEMSIWIGERFVRWGEGLRVRKSNLAPRVYPQ